MTTTDTIRDPKTITWEEFYVEPHPGREDHETDTRFCGKCGGSGYIPAFAYYADGLCFECQGERTSWTVTVKGERADEKRRAQREAGRVRKDLRARFATETFIDSVEGLREALDAGVARDDDFIVSLKQQVIRKGSLSEKQVEAALAAEARHLEREARRAAEREAASPVPTGRMEFEGEIISIKSHEAHYGGRTTTSVKGVIKTDEGWKVWGTIPAALLDTEDNWRDLRGQRVRMTATIKPSDDDHLFGFYSRPAKAVRV